MALKIYNKENSASEGRKGKCTLSFNEKGAITISKELRKTLKLNPGDGLLIAHDEDEVSDWFIKPDKDGIELRASKTNPDGALISNSAKIVKALQDSIDKEKASMAVGKEPNDQGWFPVFTSSAK